MLLSTRATETEYFDEPERNPAELAEGYAALGRVNRLLDFSCPCKRRLPQWLGSERCRSLSVLDLGAGDGAQAVALAAWAAKRGWRWRIISLDLNYRALELTKTGRKVAGSALSLPFLDNSFDVVLASSMTHHLTNDEEVVQHFREAWRVSREWVFIYDLHRNPLFLGALAVVLLMLRVPPHFRKDGLLSVRRGWHIREWRRFVTRTGITNARVSLLHGVRVLLQAHKSSLRAAVPETDLPLATAGSGLLS